MVSSAARLAPVVFAAHVRQHLGGVGSDAGDQAPPLGFDLVITMPGTTAAWTITR